MPDIFLSYNREDQATARRFAEAFQAEGLEVWWDTTLRAGEAYDQVTEKALKTAKAVVVLWSKRSVDSRWVRAEATLADRNKTLVPVTIEACDRPIMFELTQTAELSHWEGDVRDRAWQAFMGDLKRFVQSEAPASASSPAPPERPAAPARPERLSICVLPFANMSRDEDQEYFADGISEDIITDLSKVSDLLVIARNSAFTFKGRNVDVPQVARQLNVTHVLEGSVRRAGNRVRITAQLIDGSSNGHVWADRWDRDLDDIFALQDEISQAIVGALKLNLLPAEKAAIADRGTTNLEAYDFYLRARELVRQHGSFELTRAIELYRGALALDASFLAAWHGLHSALANGLIWLPEFISAAIEEMDRIAAEMVRLAPAAWQTLAVQASHLRLKRRWVEAEVAAEAALATAPPSDVDAEIGYGSSLWSVGRLGEAVEHFERARRSDPLSLRLSGYVQIALEGAGREDEAEAEFARSRDFPGDRVIWDWYALMRLWRQKGTEPAVVRAWYDRFLGRHKGFTVALNHEMASLLDDPERARAAIRQAFDDPANLDPTRMTTVGFWADHVGDMDLALASLMRCFLELGGTQFNVLWHPYETGLRHDPRFKTLIRDLGIYDYWRQSGNWGDFARPLGDDDFEFIR